VLGKVPLKQVKTKKNEQLLNRLTKQ